MRPFYFTIFLSLSILFQACAAIPMITEEWAHRKLTTLQIGEEKTQVLTKFGPPHQTTAIPVGEDLIEIYGYELGNYTYSDTGLLLFKNHKLVGVPENYYELLKMLRLLRAINVHSDFKHINDFSMLAQTS